MDWMLSCLEVGKKGCFPSENKKYSLILFNNKNCMEENKMTINQFGLVYDGAITENIAGQVNIRPVNYVRNGLKISANVYVPKNYDPTKKYPAITVAHPNGGVKEQVAGLFAQRLAENGYITIAADAAYQGASEGSPHNLDHPEQRTEDIRAMADYLLQFEGVDKEKIGALGICGGGGYTIEAAKTDKIFKAVATISLFNSGRVRRNGFQDSQISSIQERLQEATTARIKELDGETLYLGDMSTLTKEQVEALPFVLYKEGYKYYFEDYHHPNSTGTYTASSLLYLTIFDAEEHVELINQPLLMIAGNEADTLYMTKAVFEKATGTKNKELYLIEGATHIQTYWKEPYVSQELDKLVCFFRKTL